MKSVAVYPGSFDPITFGHIDIITRASKGFDTLIVAVAHESGKQPLFSVEERKKLIQEIEWPHDLTVKVDDFNGLLVDYAKSKKADVVIRGLRALSDFEHEFQMALINRKLSEEVETMFMMAGEAYSYVSSRSIKQIVQLGGSAAAFVPPHVEIALKKKLLS